MRTRRYKVSYPTPALSSREFDFNSIFTERSKKGESPSMAQIQLPPHGMGPMQWRFCVASNDKLEFDLTDPGFLDSSKDGLFSPDFPTSRDPSNPPLKPPPPLPLPLPVGVIGPFSPVVKSGEVVVGYFDDTTKRLFVVTVVIQPNCP
jgi:hypothetical protein